MIRPDSTRQPDQLRTLRMIPDFVGSADGSVLIECGRTRVLCNATLLPEVPRWLKGKGTGWVTAEYSLLPQSTSERVERERKSLSGRTQEIQRLIGRSLRAGVDLIALGERAIIVDCDVIEADGGTRTASIIGGFVALCLALQKIKAREQISDPLVTHAITAISVGLIDEIPLLDLCYIEDSHAGVDMNVVMRDARDFVEVQGTGEHSVFSRAQMNALLDLAEKGCREIVQKQMELVKTLP
ncbi:MAG TPA: ribonuclease PH [Fibrobacteraceae bacterium]|nr:ribonuclease PH [Fibrobacteraceae bacterium]